jgi:peroxiredoxin
MRASTSAASPRASWARRGASARARAPRTRSAAGRDVTRRGLHRQPVALGETLPMDVQVSYFDDDGNLVRCEFGDLLRGKTAVVFAVPGAFTPTCSTKHLPGYVERADAMRERGVDEVICVSVNDAFVMNAWGNSAGAKMAKIKMVADGSAAWSKACGVDLDLHEQGMGTRSRRYALIARDGVIEYLAMESGQKYETSGAADILERLPLP